MLQKLKICDAAKIFLIQIAHLTEIFPYGKLWSEVKDMKKFRDNIFVRIICWILYIIWWLLRPAIFIVSHIVAYLWGGVFTLTLLVTGIMCFTDGFKETMQKLWFPLLVIYAILLAVSLITVLSRFDPAFLIRRNNEEEIQPETAPIKRVVKATERQEVHYDPVKGDVTYSVERTAVGVELDQDGETVIVQEYPTYINDTEQ